RRLDVSLTDESTYTDGRAIHLDASTEGADVRDAIALQAGLLAGGSLRKDLITRLSRHRPQITQRYLALELSPVTNLLGPVLPTPTALRVKSLCPQPIPSSPEESLHRALSREPITAPPRWAGTVKPSRLRRASESDLRASPTDEDLKR